MRSATGTGRASGINAASAALSVATSTVVSPASTAASTDGSTPRIGLIRPSRASSPKQHHAQQRGSWDHAVRGQHRGGDREIEPAARLGEAGRRQSHRHPPVGPTEAAVDDRGPYPVARLVQGGVGQADQLHDRDARGEICLDFHHVALDPDQGHSVASRDGHSDHLLEVGDLQWRALVANDLDDVEPDVPTQAARLLEPRRSQPP